MEIMQRFLWKNEDKIRSEGVKKLFAFFEEHYGDKHYISLKGEIEKLKKALYDRIRSVTVAINLDERLVPVFSRHYRAFKRALRYKAVPC